ncbi:AraC family transcriptional regulator [Desulfovibrio sp. Huiquan2017]|uniref:AraC family transcriptional regulator n=1 Tax=Desulfovibrio sp. Huiquan2017 TaxID=2816861 RepID=UPI001A937B4B|nr:AraC family transcriptional regulator [Desulfovibrio sp. Huiquan2017]
MSTARENTFEFVSNGRDLGVTVLNAVMSDFSYGRHAHEEVAVGVTLGGVQEFSCKGRRFRSSPGDIILFNPDEAHNGNPGGGNALEYTMLYLDPAVFNGLAGSAADPDQEEYRVEETHFADPVLRALILRMARLAASPAADVPAIEACLYALAGRLTSRMGVYRPNSWTAAKDTLLLRAREYVHDNIEAAISIDDLSRAAHLSKYHFIRLFRSQFGLTPHQYIINYRINRVREELAAGTPPSDVAYRFGFFDVSHMHRHFKRAYGLTPRQYQIQLTR